MSIESIENKVIQWASDRNILKGSDALHQFSKTLEETNELYEALIDNDKAAIKDAIGDIMVTLAIQCQYHRLDLKECFGAAYDEIRHRKGKLVNGIFVKEK